jgi:hypothetical protein
VGALVVNTSVGDVDGDGGFGRVAAVAVEGVKRIWSVVMKRMFLFVGIWSSECGGSVGFVHEKFGGVERWGGCLLNSGGLGLVGCAF